MGEFTFVPSWLSCTRSVRGFARWQTTHQTAGSVVWREAGECIKSCLADQIKACIDNNTTIDQMVDVFQRVMDLIVALAVTDTESLKEEGQYLSCVLLISLTSSEI